MTLKNEKLKNLRYQYGSYKSFTRLIIDIIKINNVNKNKLIKMFVILIISFLFSLYCISNQKFKSVFTIMTDVNITVSVTLLALLIAGFSIVLSSLNKNSLYLLILTNDPKRKDDSFFKRTILLCIEPLIWFTILLIISFSFKIFQVIYPSEISSLNLNYIIKVSVVFFIFVVTIFSLISLKTFILNMCNLLLLYANFEILERQSKSTGSSIEELINKLENEYNKQ